MNGSSHRCVWLLSLAALMTTVLLTEDRCRAEGKDRAKWDRRYSQPGYRYGDSPAPTLTTWRALVQSRARGGRALDLACGEAQNGVFLAKLGYRVDAIDISPVALTKARKLAQRNGVSARLTPVQADLETYTLKPGRYDLIVNFRFLLRRMGPQIVAALKPGGVLVFESFTVDDAVARRKGANRSHFLKRNELLRLFRDLRVIYYHERRSAGRAVATLVARKPGAPDWLKLSDPSKGAAR